MTYLAVVSVEGLQLLDIIHVDALRQRLGAQVRRGKWRQGVGCVCMKQRGRQVSLISLAQTYTHTHTLRNSGGRNYMKTVTAVCVDHGVRHRRNTS